MKRKINKQQTYKHGLLKRYQAHIFVFGTLFFNALNSALILIILIILGGQIND